MGSTENMCKVCGEPVSDKIHLSVVVPLYKSESDLPRLLEYVKELNDNFVGGLTATFVVDGSPDSERLILESKMSSLGFPSQVIVLSKNFGVGPALHAALERSSGCATVVFGSDLQEPLDLFLTFGKKIVNEGRDVLLGQRLSREDPIVTKLFASFYWWVNRRFLENDTPRGGFDVFGLSKRARETLVKLPELNTSITSQLQWIGFDREYVAFHRRARRRGKSTWTLKKKFKLFADSVFGFSGAPIFAMVTVGVLSSLTLGLLASVTFIAAVIGVIQVPGYATIVLISAFGHSLTIACCGIIGSYLYRTFDNSKGRPKFIVADVITSSDFVRTTRESPKL